jgi:hypothetical protein
MLPALYLAGGIKGGKPGQAGRQAAASRAAAKQRQQRSGVVGAARLPDVSGESQLSQLCNVVGSMCMQL